MHIFIALAPVVIFLAVLWFMDSFRLVRPRSIVIALLYGAGAAAGCEVLHVWLMPAAGLDAQTFSRYVAPLTEEIAKAAFIALLAGLPAAELTLLEPAAQRVFDSAASGQSAEDAADRAALAELLRSAKP